MMSEQQKKAMVDNFIDKVISRKFLAWLTGTALLAFTGGITSGDWVTITAIYVGTQGAVDIVDAVARLRGL